MTRSDMKPLLIYHRGRHGHLADGSFVEENSAQAFSTALAEGAKMVECDVWGGLQIAHDPGEDSTLTLPEVLEVLDGRCSINIEIKSPEAVGATISLLKKVLREGSWNPDQIVLSSFHHHSAIRCKAELAELTVGVVNDGVLLPKYIELLAQERIDNLHLNWANIYMDAESDHTMRTCIEKHELNIWVWTVNSVEVFGKVVEYGASAVFTDQPDLLSAAL